MFNEVKDRLLWTKLKKDERIVSFIFSIEGLIIVMLIANIIYLNIYIFNHQPSLQPSVIKSDQTSTTSKSSAPTTLTAECVNCISQTPVPTNAPITPVSFAQIENRVKDYFIPLGSGTNQTSDWADVPGVQTGIDFGQYQNIKEIRFEASVYIPTANEWVAVRLYNVTDKHPVWYSEITTNGNASAYLTSPTIIYDVGYKIYQVQMKTQLQASANLVQSKIHIFLR